MTDKPNILLVITHDTGRHLGCYGWPVTTPNLDRLAGEGVRFDNYFCTAPQCSPSRGSILTGRYPHSNGLMGLIGFGGWRLPESEITLPKALAACGYDTWLWGFQHEHTEPARLGYAHDPIAFRRGEVPKIHAANVAPQVCRWLESRPAGPWFASVGFFETHIPFPNDPIPPDELARVRPLPYLPDHPDVRLDIARLQRSVLRVDAAVGEILAALARGGQDGDTLVVFTTDHGIAFPRAKCSLYDPGIGTALLMRGPGLAGAGGVTDDLLSNLDLMPSLLEWAGAPVPAAVQGRSFAGLLRGGSFEPREEIFAEMTWHDAYEPVRAIRTRRHKFIRHWQPIRANVLPKDYWQCGASSAFLRPLFDHPWPERELYDLDADPHERRNLVGTPGGKALAAGMEARLLAWMEATGDPLLRGPVALPSG